MPIDDLALNQLRERVIAHLVTVKFWGSELQIRSKMDAWLRETPSGGEVSYRLSEQFDQSLLYIPPAIEYLRMFPFSDDWKGNLECTTRGIAFFIRGSSSKLFQTELLDSMAQALAETLKVYNRVFIRGDFENGRSETVELPVGAEFLETLLECKIKYNESTLFEYLFRSWTTDVSDEISSANLLKLFLLVKSSSMNLMILQQPAVLSAAFDEELCRVHWECAAEFLARSCPSYVDRVRSLLSA